MVLKTDWLRFVDDDAAEVMFDLLPLWFCVRDIVCTADIIAILKSNLS